MIANAGLFWQKPLLESTVEEWDKMFSVNLKGVMLCFKYGAKQMIKQGRGGRIVGTPKPPFVNINLLDAEAH